MKKILVLGAGLSASTLIKYLLDFSGEYNWEVILGDIDENLAKKKIGDHPNGFSLKFDVFDEKQRQEQISIVDVVISMLPAEMHYLVAASCVLFKKHLITASYVSDEIKELDSKAKNQGVLLLNEIGVDPGIDHMSAMQVINRIKSNGGKITAFRSFTGGLVAPEYDNNPWRYKFTWNPKNVVLAGQGVSKFIRNGRYKYIPYYQLFKRLLKTTVLDVGEFEIYPNRDSLKYRETYGLADIPTMFRGTMRRHGYSDAWDVFAQLGATDDTYIMEDTENMTCRDYINSFLRYDLVLPVETKLANYVGIDKDGEIMKKLKWLGIFEKKKIGIKNATPAQILLHILEQKWQLDPEDKDMIVMKHEFQYEENNIKKQMSSSLVVRGIDNTHTAMSITVGMPIAIVTKLLLNNKISVRGVQLPIVKEIYEPVLEELKEHGVRFIEKG